MRRLVLAGAVLGALAVSTRDASAFCQITQTNSVSFGSYDVFSSSSLAIAPTSFVVTCDGSYTAVLKISLGSASTVFAPRDLSQSGQPHLAYTLYVNAAHTTVWGDGTGGSGYYSWSTTKNATYNITVYGAIASGQDVAVGSYAEPIALAVALGDNHGVVYQTVALPVTATVAQRCTIQTGALAFGNYDPVTANGAAGSDLLATGTGAVSVQCTRGTTPAPTIALGGGLYPSPAGSFNRYMGSGSHRLGYQIYTTSAHTAIWGDGTSATVAPSAATPITSMLTTQTFTAYGKVSKGQDIAVGSYTDVVVATVNF